MNSAVEWSLNGWMNDVLTSISTVFQLYPGGQCTYPCFPGVLLTSTPHNILFKPLAAFSNNHTQRWEWNKSCSNDYHQSSERILAEPEIETATSCSKVRNATDWTMGLGRMVLECAKRVNQWQNVSTWVCPRKLRAQTPVETFCHWLTFLCWSIRPDYHTAGLHIYPRQINSIQSN